MLLIFLAPQEPWPAGPEAGREWRQWETGTPLQEAGARLEAGPLRGRLAGLFWQGLSHLNIQGGIGFLSPLSPLGGRQLLPYILGVLISRLLSLADPQVEPRCHNP